MARQTEENELDPCLLSTSYILRVACPRLAESPLVSYFLSALLIFSYSSTRRGSMPTALSIATSSRATSFTVRPARFALSTLA